MYVKKVGKMEENGRKWKRMEENGRKWKNVFKDNKITTIKEKI
jgi:predicted transcriptional regulator with HTH domain